jgi:hypothetical protein
VGGYPTAAEIAAVTAYNANPNPSTLSAVNKTTAAKTTPKAATPKLPTAAEIAAAERY